jgi:WD40 repeat protein
LRRRNVGLSPFHRRAVDGETEFEIEAEIMEVRDLEKPVIEARKEAGAIIRADSQGLMVRSAGLVRRGLRDLARDSNWLIKKVFAGRSARVAISDTGQVCAIPSAGQGAARRLVLYDIEMNVPTLALSVPDETVTTADALRTAFSWSPGSRYLVAAWEGWSQPALHIFDFQSKALLGTFGGFKTFPARLEWSTTGAFFVAASRGGKQASLRLWATGKDAIPFCATAAHEMGLPDWFERQTYEAEFGEEGAFAGYGSSAFSPDETTLASVVEIRGDWADDSIVLVDAATLRKKNVFHGQGHITDIAWMPDNGQIIYCAAGQAYRLDVNALSSEVLPFGAEFCACHPHLPLCLCFSSWLKNSAKGRLFVVDLNTQEIVDEHAAENVAHLRWNSDGSKAYAVTSDGMAYIYESPLI